MTFSDRFDPINRWEVVVKPPPHDDYTWVKTKARIRCNSTTEVRESDNDAIYEDGVDCYIWEDGNYSCDCNRHLFFERAAGIEPVSEKCGTGKYSVQVYNPKNGEIIYDEFSDAPSKD